MISITKLQEEDYEAEILVKNEDYNLLCYCTSNLNSIKDIRLHAFLSQNIVKSETNNEKIVKLDNYYAYRLCCKVINRAEQLVALGEFKLEVQ